MSTIDDLVNQLNRNVESMSTHEDIFNPDPEQGNQGAMPTCGDPQPFQICTVQGSGVIEATTSAGMFIWLPAWGEKVMVWHIPSDPTTSTFGTPVPIYFSTDIDKFYERYRVISANLKIQAGTVSVTNAALSGNMNAVVAYNSIASLIGNNTSAFQIYSYENAMGFTPDVSSKVGGVPSWKGVALLFVNSPEAPIGRLEDSVVFDPQDTDASVDSVKFTNSTQNYDLNATTSVTGAALTFSLITNAVKTFKLGEFLRDSLRASTISWDLSLMGTVSAASNFTIYSQINIVLSYQNVDLVGNVVNSGVLLSQNFVVPQLNGTTSSSTFNFNRSGAFPDILNIDENNLVPPIRKTNFTLTMTNPSGITMNFALTNLRLNANYPVTNGLTPGIIQQPRFVFYTGVEVGTKLSVLGSTRLEGLPDSETARFVTNKFRKVSFDESEAIQRVIANPAEYGVRWCVPGDQYDSMMESFTTSLNIISTQNEAECFSHCLKQISNLLQNQTKETPVHEASLKSLLKKGFRGLSKIGKESYNSVVKPVLMKEWETIKTLPATAARDLVERSLMSVAAMENTYNPPRVTYQSQPSATTHIAASGYLPRSTRAATRMPKYQAATTAPKGKSWTLIDDNVPTKDPTLQTVMVPLNKVTLFPTVNFLGPDLADSESGSAVDIFAIVPANLCPDLTLLPTFTCPNRKVIKNYSSYNSKTLSSTTLFPNQDVVLLRLQQINPTTGEAILVSTDKPVGGRSLELAMYMFNNNIHGSTVFTGAIESGNIMPLSDSMLRLKKAFCEKQGFITCGNGDYDIRSDKLITLLSALRKHITPVRSLNHYNAHSPCDFKASEVKALKPFSRFFTEASVVKMIDIEQYNPILSMIFETDDSILQVNNITGWDLPHTTIHNRFYYDPEHRVLFVKPTIQDMHEFNKQYLYKKWWTPLPNYDKLFSPQGVPVAATRALDKSLTFRSSKQKRTSQAQPLAATKIPDAPTLFFTIKALSTSQEFATIANLLEQTRDKQQEAELQRQLKKLENNAAVSSLTSHVKAREVLPKLTPKRDNSADIRRVRAKIYKLSWIFGNEVFHFTDPEILSLYNGYKDYLVGRRMPQTSTTNAEYILGRAMPIDSTIRNYFLDFFENPEQAADQQLLQRALAENPVFVTEDWKRGNPGLIHVENPFRYYPQTQETLKAFQSYKALCANAKPKVVIRDPPQPPQTQQ